MLSTIKKYKKIKLIILLTSFIALLSLKTQAAIDIPDNSLVKIRGQALSRPGQFGKQFFYLYHQGEVIQIYNYWQRFPNIEIGDYLEIKASFSKLNTGPRFKTKEISDIATITKGDNYIVNPNKINNQKDLDGQAKISFVEINGLINKINKNSFKITNNFSDFFVDLQYAPDFNLKTLTTNQQITVTGLLFKNSSDFKIYPLTNKGLKILEAPTLKATQAPPLTTQGVKTKPKTQVLKYLGLTLTCLLIFTIIRRP